MKKETDPTERLKKLEAKITRFINLSRETRKADIELHNNQYKAARAFREIMESSLWKHRCEKHEDYMDLLLGREGWERHCADAVLMSRNPPKSKLTM